MKIGRRFMTDVGCALSSALDDVDAWEADALALQGCAYTISRKSDGLMLWVANGRSFFDFYERGWKAACLNWWDRRECWPKAQAIARRPLVEKVAAFQRAFIQEG